MNLIQQAEDLLQHALTLDYALDIAWALGEHPARVKVDEGYITLLQLDFPLWTPANEIEVQFYGGPVGCWYTGTLHEFIIDRIIQAITVLGLKETKALLQ